MPPLLLRLPFGRRLGLAMSERVVKGMQKKYSDLDDPMNLDKVNTVPSSWTNLAWSSYCLLSLLAARFSLLKRKGSCLDEASNFAMCKPAGFRLLLFSSE